jgi:hypothetical protein
VLPSVVEVSVLDFVIYDRGEIRFALVVAIVRMWGRRVSGRLRQDPEPLILLRRTHALSDSGVRRIADLRMSSVIAAVGLWMSSVGTTIAKQSWLESRDSTSRRFCSYDQQMTAALVRV